MSDTKKTTAIVLAGGSGIRLGGDVPKQFLVLDGKPLVIHALEQFENCDSISDIIIVCRETHVEILDKMIKKNRIKKVKCIVPGGDTRQKSSFIGVKNCSTDTHVVLIHDAVRPFIDIGLIEDIIAKTIESGAVIPVVDVICTIIREKKDMSIESTDRQELKVVQTPQGFQYKIIYEAHKKALETGVADVTDDCNLVMLLGDKISTIRGREYNIKITDRKDLIFAEIFLKTGLIKSQ